jgi:hypothetical protein
VSTIFTLSDGVLQLLDVERCVEARRVRVEDRELVHRVAERAAERGLRFEDGGIVRLLYARIELGRRRCGEGGLVHGESIVVVAFARFDAEPASVLRHRPYVDAGVGGGLAPSTHHRALARVAVAAEAEVELCVARPRFGVARDLPDHRSARGAGRRGSPLFARRCAASHDDERPHRNSLPAHDRARNARAIPRANVAIRLDVAGPVPLKDG